MKVASNKIRDIIEFYYSELSALYERNEIEAIVKMVFEHYLGINRNEIPLKLNDNVNQSDLLKVYDCCKELTTGKPVQYVIGETWFYNYRFRVNQHVLIPRPETEELVAIIIKENPADASYIDIGTGSGCIPVSIKCVFPKAKVFACDVSNEALDVARENAKLNNADVTFFETDILDKEKTLKNIEGSFDVIISNPPYIKRSEAKSLSKNVFDFEPHTALFVEGDDDIIFYKVIIDLARYKLNAGGRLYFELNPLTAGLVHDYAVSTNLFANIDMIQDLSGNLRFMKAVKST